VATVKRKMWTVLSLGIVVLWLVLSYQPHLIRSLQIAFPREAVGGLFTGLLAVSAALFLGIQTFLVACVFKLPQRVSRQEAVVALELPPESLNQLGCESRPEICIDRRLELLWTLLPLLTTLGLTLAGWNVLSSPVP